MGLLALMLLHESRRHGAHDAGGRPGPAGGAGPVAVGPRAHRGRLASGGRALASRRVGPYTFQAAIAAVHAGAPAPRPTRTGARSSGCTTCCPRGPVAGRGVEPGRGVAMRDGPAAGLALIDGILAAGRWRTTTWPTRPARTCAGGWAGWPRRAASYERALALARQEPERRFLRARLLALADVAGRT